MITTSGAYTTLHSFSGADGADLEYSLVEGSDGDFYGTTVGGGTSNRGTVFKITPTGTLTTLHSFSGTDGEYPYCILAIGTDGNFYGTTNGGGTNNEGAIFKITPSGTLTTIYSCSPNSHGNADGGAADQTLLLGTDGNFYGEADIGGTNNTGTVFQITPSGTLTTLYTFSADSGGNADGADPDANGCWEGADGSLYGTVQSGGNNDYGTIFKIAVPSLTATATPAPTPRGSGVRFDFDGDGKSDLIWYNTASGDVST